jgi:hypothetical protein
MTTKKRRFVEKWRAMHIPRICYFPPVGWFAYIGTVSQYKGFWKNRTNLLAILENVGFYSVIGVYLALYHITLLRLLGSMAATFVLGIQVEDWMIRKTKAKFLGWDKLARSVFYPADFAFMQYQVFGFTVIAFLITAIILRVI